MSDDEFNGGIAFYRDRFMGSKKMHGLSQVQRMYWLYSLMMLTDPRFGSPTRGCLVVGNSPMSVEDWARALGIVRTKSAQEHWDCLIRAGAFEEQEIDGKRYVHCYGFERNQNRERYSKYNRRRDEIEGAEVAVQATHTVTKALRAPRKASKEQQVEARRQQFEQLAAEAGDAPTQGF